MTSIPETQSGSESGSSSIDGIEIQSVGVPFEYTIPAFTCVSFTLRQITFNALVDSGNINTYHGFIRHNPCLELDLEYPRTIDVFESCFVQVEELCKSAPARHLKHPNEGVYLVWKWNWASTTPSHSRSCSIASSTKIDESNEAGTMQRDADSSTSDTVRFKVIGATRDKKHQNALEKVNEAIHSGQDVNVVLCKEPENPFDSMAVAFKCYLDGKWQRIGYVVREALDDVHEAIRTNSIQSLELAWVKFRIDFHASGPGFYASVNITRKGRWSSVVYRSASAK